MVAAGKRLGLLPNYWSNIGGTPNIDSAVKMAFDGATLVLPDNSATAGGLPRFLSELRATGWTIKAAGGK